MTKYKLSEIGTIVGGGTPATKHSEYYTKNGYSWITPKDLSRYNNMYIFKGERDITKAGLDNSSACLVPKNTVLVSSRAPIGYVAIAGKSLATNQGFKSIIPNEKYVLPEYLYFLMITKKKELENISSGSTFKEVSGRTMKNFEVNIPSISYQKKVIKYIQPLVKKIELNDQINANLLELIITIWKNFSLRVNNNRSVSLKDISKNIITGKTPSTYNKDNYGKDIPFVKIPDMHNKIFIIETAQYLSKNGALSQKSKFIPSNSIIVSCIGTPGLVSITTQEVQTNQQINSIVIDKKYLYYIFLELRMLRDQINVLGSGGTTIKNLNKKDFSNISIQLPDENELVRFNCTVNPLFQKIYANSLQSQKLLRIKNEILTKLF